jgi:hypothetical protein
MALALEVTLEDVGDPMVFAVEVIRVRLSAMLEELEFLELLLVTVEGEALKRRSSGRRIARAKAGMEEAQRQVTLAGEQIKKALIGEGHPLNLAWNEPGDLVVEEQGDPVRCILDAVSERMTGMRSGLSMVLVQVLVWGRTSKVRGRALARARRAIQEARLRFDEAGEEVASVYSAECGVGRSRAGARGPRRERARAHARSRRRAR